MKGIISLHKNIYIYKKFYIFLNNMISKMCQIKRKMEGVLSTEHFFYKNLINKSYRTKR